MGCGTSAENGDVANVANDQINNQTNNTQARDRYRRILATADMTSDHERLHEELDMRTVSHGVAASEPGDAETDRLREGLIRRGVRFGINPDPAQFPITILDFPEFRRRDRRRVEDWDRDCVAVYRRGEFAPLPANGIEYKPDERIAWAPANGNGTANAAIRRRADSTATSPTASPGSSPSSPLVSRSDTSATVAAHVMHGVTHPAFCIAGDSSTRSETSIFVTGTELASETDISARSTLDPTTAGGLHRSGGGEASGRSLQSRDESNAATLGHRDLESIA